MASNQNPTTFPTMTKLPTNVFDWTQMTVLSWEQVARGVQSPRGLECPD